MVGGCIELWWIGVHFATSDGGLDRKGLNVHKWICERQMERLWWGKHSDDAITVVRGIVDVDGLLTLARIDVAYSFRKDKLCYYSPFPPRERSLALFLLLILSLVDLFSLSPFNCTFFFGQFFATSMFARGAHISRNTNSR